VWLTLAKKGTIEPTRMTYEDALAEAIGHGWIDGQLARGDDGTFRRKFTPLKPGSSWSKRNVALASKLADQGRMRPSGLEAVSRAKADGIWEAAYYGQATIEVPEDLAVALAGNPSAHVKFNRLSAANRYAVICLVTTAKRADARQRRIAQFVAMLARGESIHPQ